MGEDEFLIGAHRVGEGGDQREEGLSNSPLTRDAMLFGLGASGFEGGGAVDVAVREVDTGQDTAVTIFRTQGGDDRESGGKVAADTREVGKSPSGARGEPAVGVGDVAYAGQGVVGAAEVLVRLGR
ncbi:hypothetical protein AB0B79_32820 [Streptomyces sp. NPDC039022]|uniref:hypothetical protein n=1 Tax=unclassified Streptomyces TaxID=2593676 RepID=UPI0033F35555